MNLLDAEWDIPIHTFSDPTGKFFNVGNGCINQTDNGYVLINRIQNYHTSLGRHHPSQKLKVQTVSVPQWIDLDKDFNVVGTHLISQKRVFESSLRPVDRQLIIGLEDMRMFRGDLGDWWFVASTGHYEDWDKKEFWGQCWGNLTTDTQSVNFIAPLKYKDRRMMEKNWLPFMMDGSIFFIYESNPLTILKPINSECVVIHKGEKRDWPIMRGSGSPIRYGDRWLYTIHEQGIIRDDEPLKDQYFYYHRFVEMGDDFQITRVSPLFNFREEGVEYTCGHCLSHDQKELVIAYSSHGGTDSNLMGVAVETVEEMLSCHVFI